LDSAVRITEYAALAAAIDSKIAILSFYESIQLSF
jgi:hypothetical protein